MLKITKVEIETEETQLRLDGALSGVWVGELESLCATAQRSKRTLTVDCAGLLFLDMSGVALMRRLLAQNVALQNCSPFVEMQLKAPEVMADFVACNGDNQ